jgi:4-amino-4-deoxy-L-arabinose transferase-like glycosyltransferase
MLAASILLGVEARLAKTDAMLLSTVVAAMGALGRVYLANHGSHIQMAHRWTWPAIFWTAVAGGILLKGPLILMFVALTAAALSIIDRSARWLIGLKPIAGIFWLLLLVLPWFIAIIAKSGDSFFAESIGNDLFAKVGAGQESHGAPPGLYFVLFWVTFWPGSMLVGLAAPGVRDRLDQAAALCAAALPADCDPRRRHSRPSGPIAPALARGRHGVVVHHRDRARARNDRGSHCPR